MYPDISMIYNSIPNLERHTIGARRLPACMFLPSRSFLESLQSSEATSLATKDPQKERVPLLDANHLYMPQIYYLYTWVLKEVVRLEGLEIPTLIKKEKNIHS
jgi:hypothetical protein